MISKTYVKSLQASGGITWCSMKRPLLWVNLVQHPNRERGVQRAGVCKYGTSHGDRGVAACKHL